MATRTINSAGVQILERDLSLRLPQNVGTNVFVTGFTNQGPTDEVIKISTRDEFEQIYGTPTNSAERYFYYSVRELLNSPANIYTYRLPYGANSGDGFGSQYSALLYPVQSVDLNSPTAGSSNLDLSGNCAYFLGEPTHVDLTESQYNQALEGTLFDWSATATNAASFNATSAYGKAGVIVLNKAKTTINSQFEGYYVGLADNTNINPATNYDAVKGVQTLSLTGSQVNNLSGAFTYTSIPAGTLQFSLTATPTGVANSVSQIMENLTDYNIDGRNDDDLLNLGVFKLRKSLYATESFKLDYLLEDAIVGSIDTFRTQLNPTGGPAIPFFLEQQDTNSRNVEILVNPYISNKFRQSSLDSSGIPTKKVRVLTNGMITNYATISSSLNNVPLSTIQSLSSTIGFADNLYPLGAYSNTVIKQKLIGSIPSKIDRALDSIRNDEVYDIDVIAEAGLGTIFAVASAAGTDYYDDTLYNSTLKTKIDSLRTSQDISGNADATAIRANYTNIFNKFENFCNLPSNTGGRGDCVFIADPIRHFLVTGRNTKILSDKTKNFQTDVYWPIRHQFELTNSSYAITYGNWVLIYDDFTGENVWIPFSPFAASAMARTDANEYPWSAPAGYTRGIVTTALDIAVNPNQKQRDDLYKSNINPLTFSANDGIVIIGQKTLNKKPSAFDRINVRRLFLTLERPTKKVAKYFLFEPNNDFTRTRFVNTLTPLFEYAKQNGGCYDYLIVCDERNNTAEVIDANELHADVFIKPTKTAEFITVTFTATRTDANFKELV
jgi:hypothetical protein